MESLKNIEVSFYKNVKDTLGVKTNLIKIIEDIKNGKYSDKIQEIRNTSIKSKRNKLKSLLPCFTLSGTFKKRNLKGLINYNGLIQIDIDNVNPNDLKAIIELVNKDNYTYISFVSPSGNGLKIIVKSTKDISSHLSNFKELQHYYKQEYNISVDSSTKDISRLFFVSYDKELFYNEKSKVYKGNTARNTDENQRNTERNTENQRNTERNTDENQRNTYIKQYKTDVHNNNNIIDVKTSVTHYNKGVIKNVTGVTTDVQLVIQRITESKTDITKGYTEWLKLGFAFADTFGENGRSYYHEISSYNSGYDLDVCNSQYNECLKSNGQGVTIAYFFKLAKDYGIDINTYNSEKIKTVSKKHTGGKTKETIKVQKETKKYTEQDYSKNGFYEENGKYFIKQKGNKVKISNCTFEILYFFPDGSNNANRLLKIKNKQNGKSLIELSAKDSTSLTSFKAALRSKGNYVFKGNLTHLETIFEVLGITEITAEKLEVLGFQPKTNDYAFSNGVLTSAGEFLPVNDLGVVVNGSNSVFIPANSSLYKEDGSYNTTRCFVFQEGTINFKKWSKLMVKAYGKKGLIASAFLVSALFRDLIFKKVGHFPFLFLYGEAGTGKTTFVKCFLRFFVNDIEKWSIVSTSTEKAIGRKITSARGSIFYLKEFSKDISTRDIEFLKSVYDGVGYDRAVMSNDNRTHQTDVKSAIVIDGNSLPTQQGALLDRMLLLDFAVSQYSSETSLIKNEILEEIEKGGGQILKELLKQRTNISKRLNKTYNEIYQELKEKSQNSLSERTLNNLSSIATPFLSMDFNFTINLKDDLINALLFYANSQNETMKFANETSVFWESVKYYLEDNNHSSEHYGLYKTEKYLGLKLNKYFMKYLEYMKLNNNSNHFVKAELIKTVFNESNPLCLETSTPISWKNGSVRCAKFSLEVLK